jgi:hypothetical protein
MFVVMVRLSVGWDVAISRRERSMPKPASDAPHRAASHP